MATPSISNIANSQLGNVLYITCICFAQYANSWVNLLFIQNLDFDSVILRYKKTQWRYAHTQTWVNVTYMQCKGGTTATIQRFSHVVMTCTWHQSIIAYYCLLLAAFILPYVTSVCYCDRVTKRFSYFLQVVISFTQNNLRELVERHICCLWRVILNYHIFYLSLYACKQKTHNLH